MINSRIWIPTICLLAGVAAAQPPAPRPAAAPRVMLEDDVPTPPAPAAYPATPAPPAPPAVWSLDVPPQPPVPAAARSRGYRATPVPPAPPAAWDYDRPSPAAAPRPPALRAWATPPAPPAPPAFDQDFPPTPKPVPAPAAPRNFEYDFDFKFDNFDFDMPQKFELDHLKDQMFELKSRMPGMLADADIAGKLAGQFAFMPQQIMKGRQNQSDDRLYSAGQNALDGRRWEEALEAFNQLAARGGSRADAALYWKSYALVKLGRRNDALAAIGELRKSYASSRYLDEAKALEVEAGKPVSPESESDDELKLLALNGLMQSDPERALPLLEGLLKGAQSPSFKKKVIYVLAQTSIPKAQALLEQVARGGSNPDLQAYAIRYIGEHRRANAGQLLAEIYTASADVPVKRQVLNSFNSLRDKDHLLQIIKTERNAELRLEAIRMLSGMGGASADLWQIYQAEPAGDAKLEILQTLSPNGNMDKYIEIGKSGGDVKLRRYAIQQLGNSRAVTTGDALASIYASESDQDIKRAIIDSLSGQRNAKALVSCAKAEKDNRMQQRIIERLASIKSPETTDYLMEILKK